LLSLCKFINSIGCSYHNCFTFATSISKQNEQFIRHYYSYYSSRGEN